ncbi:growth/differentiation factor 8-like [Ornithodoros turicata]
MRKDFGFDSHGTLSECFVCCFVLTAVSAAVIQSPAVGNDLSTGGNSQCKDCAVRKMLEDTASDEYRQARIEFIKQQILKKLRLKQPPNVKIPRSILPTIFAESDVLPENDDDDDDDRKHSGGRRVDDFYGTMKTAVMFPENGTHMCPFTGPYPANCFIFKLSPEVTSSRVSHAELWAFKLPDASLRKHSFVVSELSFDSESNLIRKQVVAFETSANESGWFRFNVTSHLTQWANHRNPFRALEIACETCDANTSSLVGIRDDKKPFIFVRTDPSRQIVTRERRHINCDPSISRCCRESFYVSFDEIGWNSWIVHPAGYSANYCRGSCVHDISTNKYHHTTVLQKVLLSSTQTPTPSLSLCCTPSRLSSISLIYLDSDGTMKQKSLPNMVVEACECA